MTSEKPLPDGVFHWPGYFDPEKQRELLAEIREKTAVAPLFVPRMPKTGKEMSVRMTNFGVLGWVTDKEHGYRYQEQHPVTGKAWPEIPNLLLDMWNDLSGFGIAMRRVLMPRFCPCRSVMSACSEWAVPAGVAKPSPSDCEAVMR